MASEELEPAPATRNHIASTDATTQIETKSTKKGLVNPEDAETASADGANAQEERGWRFYAVFPGLCLVILLVALDTSVVGIALPSITASLDAGALYVWAVNGYYLTLAIGQPLVGQIANLFGRQTPMLMSLAMFAIGSGLSGGATTAEMLIAGRVVQGIGGGGMTVLTAVVVADLVPLRKRPKYLAFTMAFFALGTFIGPLVSGAVIGGTSWRWVFYLNLPICGLALVLFLLFLRVKHDTTNSVWAKVAALDWSGNMLVSASVVSILISLTWGGTLYPWISTQVLVPLLVGALGLGLTILHQHYIATTPTIPLRILGNAVSLLGFLLTFFHGIIMSWLPFALPIYFQALKEMSPLDAAINCLPVAAPFAPAGIIGGLIIAKTGRYKPILAIGSFLMPISAGCLSLLGPDSSQAVYVIIQLIAGAAPGLALPCTLPAIQASLPEEDVATATALNGFLRSFGFIWGAAIPAAVFNSKVDALLGQVSDPATQELLARGGAYQHGTKVFMTSLNAMPELKAQVIDTYTAALKEMWYVYIAFGAITVPMALLIREIPLRTRLDTKFGLKDEAKKNEKAC